MLAETDVVQQALIAAAVGAVGALIAGVTAVVKSWFAGRDQRLRASNQLDLATKRSQFVQDWVSAHEHLPLDDEARQRINARAVEELDEAYQEAQIGFARGRSAASVPFSQTVKDQLRELFAAHGEVAQVEIVKDKFTERSRGFGFVEMATDEGAAAAIAALNKHELEGRPLTVNEARPRTEGGRRGGGGGEPRW